MLGGKKTFAVIRAVYENRYSPEEFVRELDFVLEKNVNVIIIEPDELGEVTWRWIRAGNWLHKTAVLSGLAAIGGALVGVYAERHITRSAGVLAISALTAAAAASSPPMSHGISAGLLPSVFFGLASATCASLYALFWQWDPCSKYQVAKSLASLPTCVVAAATSPPQSTSSTPESEGGCPSNGNTPPRSSHPGVDWNHHPVVLIRRDDRFRKVLHNSVSVGALLCVGMAVCRWR